MDMKYKNGLPITKAPYISFLGEMVKIADIRRVVRHLGRDPEIAYYKVMVKKGTFFLATAEGWQEITDTKRIKALRRI